MDSTQLKKRTKLFALMVIDLVGQIPENTAGRAIRNQLIRCGTSVGANYRAACRAKSTADFISKIDNVEEEADESCYWIELTAEAALLPRETVAPVWREANELTAIFTQISKTSKDSRDKLKRV
ncbi:MAG TPA: four helix bundle protein [Fibrella sp.]|jgi:four helix bundle protein